MNKIILCLIALCFVINVNGQFGYGLTLSNDFYHRYVNPDDEEISKAAGSAILNFGLGPKIWVGGKKMSVSAEAQACIGLFGLSIKDYKGLGTASFPMMVKLNFNGLSALDKEGQMGFSIGGGIQYSKTELFGLSDDYEELGIKRKLFRTYIVQAGYGFGLSGFGIQGFARYGWNKDTNASVLAIGIQSDINIKQTKKIVTPESSL